MTIEQLKEIPPVKTITRYLALVNYGGNVWGSNGTYHSAEEAQEAVSTYEGANACRVFMVQLPAAAPKADEV